MFAWTSFDEKERESLEEGKVADMLILSDNPYQMGEKIKKTKGRKLVAFIENISETFIKSSFSCGKRIKKNK